MFMGTERKNSYTAFVVAVLPSVLLKSSADKAFLAKIAKSAITNASQTCPTTELSNLLIEHCESKNLNLAEFCLQSLANLCKHAEN